jgi:predicted dehydrogenase
MKAVVVGGGSIGVRHLQNLKRLGVQELTLVEPEKARRELLARTEGVAASAALEPALDAQPDFVVISSPSFLHVEQALAAARRGCHLFIEKPLSVSNEGLAELAEEVNGRDLITLVGCNMRFHPGPALVKTLLHQDKIGSVLFARLCCGSYLPGWRRTQDYRQSYSARSTMGGGCIFDCIHEIDLARWFLGDVETVFCAAGHLSSLQIDVEDVAMLVCKHRTGSLSHIHLDYVQRTYERGCHIVGEQGAISWDFLRPNVRCYTASDESEETLALPESWQINQMYLDEMRHFLHCVEHRTPTTLPVSEAVQVMAMALAAKQSASTGQSLSLASVFQ